MNPIILPIDETKNFMTFQELTSGKIFEIEKSDFKQALNKFKIWRNDIGASSFSAELFRLMCHADCINMNKILTGFPEETIVYLLWYHSDTEYSFYKRYDKSEGEINES